MIRTEAILILQPFLGETSRSNGEADEMKRLEKVNQRRAIQRSGGRGMPW